MNFKDKLTIFTRSFFLQTGWNYLRFQGLGFAFVMTPWLKKFYKAKALDSALLRYMETFNTNPIMASFCYGALARSEGDVALAPMKKTEWRVIKTFLASSSASIGDRLFWDSWKPLTLAAGILAAYLCAMGTIDIFYSCYISNMQAAFLLGFILVVYNSITLYVRWKGIEASYEGDRDHAFGLLIFDWNRAIKVFRFIGLIITLLIISLYIYDTVKVFFFSAEIFIFTAIILFVVVMSGFAQKYDIPSVYLYILLTLIFSLVAYFI
ncbi:Phosphotransferase system, mannose/fructose/N-acetylgalactosamine [Elusimicrobium minutum Pei191]|uniref:Phosphotransferase system, mannose/fructose/N-acetylgalactosamine n=1 Tax=Elusimicrobium minutum (strain Pei191) TaxID=445932 RepID=B2KAZ9_ELUMP|nr:PTS system mannose/fructose/sorbose family transporter subunit IID [Elusimicrobium minutum]ACC97695.1 Phosphotransferase system, mannose/fructose/N-acetylgalactosamine [Elusimicrobium minutum Pei191]